MASATTAKSPFFLTKRVMVVAAVLLGVATWSRGCVASEFRLSPESRLPAWFRLEEGQVRNDYTVALAYYDSVFGLSAGFELIDESGVVRSVMVKRTGPVLVGPPLEAGTSFEVFTVDGIAEVVEHRGVRGDFSITDDPAVYAALGLQSPR